MKCPCSICGQDVTVDQQYWVDHVVQPDGTVAHRVTHFECLTSQGSGENTSPEVAASTSRSKED